MNLFIHCGLHKTATTSFQILCKKNQAELFEFGIHYPDYSKRGQHSFLLHDLQRQNIEVVERFLAKTYSEAVAKCHTVLLSGEDFENCIVDLTLANEIESAAKKTGFDSITWIVVTRNQSELLKSLYAEMSKHNITLDFETMKVAALERGCFYTATAYYNYIFVLDYSRFEYRFKNGTSGNKIQIEYDDFIKDFVGKAVFSLLLQEPEVEKFKKIAKFDQGKNNKRASDSKVEANYLKTALRNRRSIFLPSLLVMHQWIMQRRIFFR